MRTVWSILLCICLALIPVVGINSQTFASRRITVQDGLSQNTIDAICQDDRGFMWFGTLEGLNRCDGYEFTTFQNDPLDSTSLSNNYVRSIIKDDKGQLWIGTAGGLNLWDNHSASFRRFLHDERDEFSLASNDIHCLLEDEEHNIWIGTSSGISILDPETGRFSKVLKTKDKSGIPDDMILSLLSNQEGFVTFANLVVERIETDIEMDDGMIKWGSYMGNENNGRMAY